jgi:hypothetical protein
MYLVMLLFWNVAQDIFYFMDDTLLALGGGKLCGNRIEHRLIQEAAEGTATTAITSKW